MRRKSWQKRVEKVEDHFEPRLMALLNRIAALARDRALQVGPIDDMTDEEYSWSFIVHPVAVPPNKLSHWHETDLNVQITLSESMIHEGDESGINFRLVFAGDGGHDFVVISPFNYTPQCWVPLNDTRALEARLQIVEETAEDGFLEALKQLEAKCSTKPNETA